MNHFLDIPQVQLIISGILGALLRFFMGAARANKDLSDRKYSEVVSAYFQKQYGLLIVNFLVIVILAYIADNIWGLDATQAVVDRTNPSSAAGKISRGFNFTVKIAGLGAGALFDYVLDFAFGTAKAWLRAKSAAAGASMSDITPVNQTLLDKAKVQLLTPAPNP